jgi:hypothetical protein
VVFANRNNSSPSSAPATSSSEASAYPSVSQPALTTSSADTPTVSVPPPLMQTPDSYGDICYGFHLNGHDGWATNSGRGTDQTSCQFANNVLLAYWQTYSSPSRESRRVIVGSRVACPEVSANAPVPVQCSGNDFVMSCVVNSGDTWITCTGGNGAKVYLY